MAFDAFIETKLEVEVVIKRAEIVHHRQHYVFNRFELLPCYQALKVSVLRAASATAGSDLDLAWLLFLASLTILARDGALRQSDLPLKVALLGEKRPLFNHRKGLFALLSIVCDFNADPIANRLSKHFVLETQSDHFPLQRASHGLHQLP